MKNLLKKVSISTLLVISTSIFSMQGLSVITITTDDPEGYVAVSYTHLTLPTILRV